MQKVYLVVPAMVSPHPCTTSLSVYFTHSLTQIAEACLVALLCSTSMHITFTRVAILLHFPAILSRRSSKLLMPSLPLGSWSLLHALSSLLWLTYIKWFSSGIFSMSLSRNAWKRHDRFIPGITDISGLPYETFLKTLNPTTPVVCVRIITCFDFILQLELDYAW